MFGEGSVRLSEETGPTVLTRGRQGEKMRKIRFLTAGESHGSALMVILEGIPAGLPLTKAEIDRDLARRQHGFGRGGRMVIEQDEVEIISGLSAGLGRWVGSW